MREQGEIANVGGGLSANAPLDDTAYGRLINASNLVTWSYYVDQLGQASRYGCVNNQEHGHTANTGGETQYADTPHTSSSTVLCNILLIVHFGNRRAIYN